MSRMRGVKPWERVRVVSRVQGVKAVGTGASREPCARGEGGPWERVRVPVASWDRGEERLAWRPAWCQVPDAAEAPAPPSWFSCGPSFVRRLLAAALRQGWGSGVLCSGPIRAKPQELPPDPPGSAWGTRRPSETDSGLPAPPGAVTVWPGERVGRGRSLLRAPCFVPLSRQRQVFSGSCVSRHLETPMLVLPQWSARPLALLQRTGSSL